MAEKNIMAILENEYGNNRDQEDQSNPTNLVDNQQTAQVDPSLLRLMKISNEFVAIKDSMEMFPLPGNSVQLQGAANIGSDPQVGDFGKGVKATDLLMSMTFSTEANKHKIEELATNAMDEVTKMFMEGEPLWHHDLDRGIEVLNVIEYERKFISSKNLDTTLDDIIKIIAVDSPLNLPDLDGILVTNNNSNDSSNMPSGEQVKAMKGQRSLHVVHHGSREVGYIQMPAVSIVEILMDVRLWSFVFSEMLSRATVLGIITPGAPETFDGALQMMVTEYHVPSPLLSTRQSCFTRYCKELALNIWAIADTSLDSLIENPLINYKRRPSGCLIQGLPDGNTQVTWIEHTKAEVASVHPLFKSLVSSGLVFSAKHWVDTLARQCQHLHMLIQHSLHGHYKDLGPYRMEGILRLAERMQREFYAATSSTKGNGYKPLSIKGGDDILIKTLNSDESPALLTITTSSWFPFSAKKVFSFLADDRNRTKWDMLALERSSEEIIRFHSGQGPEDIVSITKMVDGKGGIDTLFLHKKHENAIVSYVIFSPITYASLLTLSSQGGNTDEIPVTPSGFAILSDENASQAGESAGSIVTLLFQLLDSSSRRAQKMPKKFASKLDNLVKNTLCSIRAALFETPGNTNQTG